MHRPAGRWWPAGEQAAEHGAGSAVPLAESGAHSTWAAGIGLAVSVIAAWRPKAAAASPRIVPTVTTACTTATASVQTTRATGELRSFGVNTETSEKPEYPCTTASTMCKCGTTATSTMEAGMDFQQQQGGQRVIKEIGSTTSRMEAVTAIRQTSLATCSTGAAGGTTKAPEGGKELDKPEAPQAAPLKKGKKKKKDKLDSEPRQMTCAECGGEDDVIITTVRYPLPCDLCDDESAEGRLCMRCRFFECMNCVAGEGERP